MDQVDVWSDILFFAFVASTTFISITLIYRWLKEPKLLTTTNTKFMFYLASLIIGVVIFQVLGKSLHLLLLSFCAEIAYGLEFYLLLAWIRSAFASRETKNLTLSFWPTFLFIAVFTFRIFTFLRLGSNAQRIYDLGPIEWPHHFLIWTSGLILSIYILVIISRIMWEALTKLKNPDYDSNTEFRYRCYATFGLCCVVIICGLPGNVQLILGRVTNWTEIEIACLDLQSALASLGFLILAIQFAIDKLQLSWYQKQYQNKIQQILENQHLKWLYEEVSKAFPTEYLIDAYEGLAQGRTLLWTVNELLDGLDDFRMYFFQAYTAYTDAGRTSSVYPEDTRVQPVITFEEEVKVWDFCLSNPTITQDLVSKLLVSFEIPVLKDRQIMKKSLYYIRIAKTVEGLFKQRFQNENLLEKRLIKAEL